MYDCFLENLKKQDVEILENFSLHKISSIGIGGRARFLVYPKSETALISTLANCRFEQIPFRLIGRMTNILPRDEDFDGVVISTSRLSLYSVSGDTLTVSCGAVITKLIPKLSEFSLGGMEELYGIPGTLGGMALTNAGAFGKQLSDLIIDARVLDEKGRIYTLSCNELGFSYRKSAFSESERYLLSARLQLSRKRKHEIQNAYHEILERRKDTQPYGEKSLGSIFKRHGDIPISKLVDELGLKGARVGGAEISKKHAGFIVAKDGATERDVKALIALIKDRVYSKFGFVPEEEIIYF